ncbi:hypothetical protein F4680DRAFT_464569 [Xylaria scruposa]|nr:hypothetical protein F4680DRAFT_464569 [Xylaria scruposa]
MSRNPNNPITAWIDTPPEMLLMYLSNMDPSSRINVANAYPEVFLRPGFNVYLQDAEDQARTQNNHTDPTVPLVVTPNKRPLLYQALEDGVDISIIEGMLRVYTDFLPTSINGVWGQSPTTPPAPLIHAAWLGRSRAVALMLRMGANPLVRCGPQNYRSAVTADCQFAAYSHAVCQLSYQATQPHRTNCITALGAALFKAITLKSIGQEHRDLESCALMLYRAGVPIPTEGAHPPATPNIALRQKIDFPIRAGFFDLLQAILEPVVHLRRNDPHFREILYFGLTVAVNFQKSDDQRNIIDYLISSGSRILPSTTIPYFDNTPAHFASRLAHFKTANFFLNQYINLGTPLEYGTFGLYRSPDRLPFVQSLYRAMSRGGFLDFQPAAAKVLHEYLVGQAIRDIDDASVIQWLADQKVTTLLNVHYAILRNNMPALRALIGAGLPVNAQTSITSPAALRRMAFYVPYPTRATSEETPLNLALRLKMYQMACFLIHRGAKPSLISDKVKKALIEDFQVRYGMAYADSTPKASPAMLQPDYFTTFDADTVFDMFHYILG